MGRLTLNAEHLADLQGGAPDFAKGADDSLGVGLREEGAGVQDRFFLAFENKEKPLNYSRNHKTGGFKKGTKAGTLSSPGLEGFRVFFATSAIAPIPSLTAKPAKKTTKKTNPES